MRIFKKLDPVFYGIAQISGYLSSVLLLGMMALIVSDVLLRFAADKPILGAFEICQMIMAMLVLLAFPYAQKRKSIIHVTFLLFKYRGKIKYVIWFLGNILEAVIFYLFGFFTIKHSIFLKTSGATSGTLLIPYWPFYLVVGIGLLLFAVIVSYDSVKYFASIFDDEMAETINKEWSS